MWSRWYGGRVLVLVGLAHTACGARDGVPTALELEVTEGGDVDVTFTDIPNSCQGRELGADEPQHPGDACVGMGSVPHCSGPFLILLDASAAMLEPAAARGLTRWDVVTRGIEQFLDGRVGHPVPGLQLYAGAPPENCEAAVGSELTVDMDAEGDASSAIIEALAEWRPAGESELFPALPVLTSYLGEVFARSWYNVDVVVIAASPPTWCGEHGAGALNSAVEHLVTLREWTRVHVIELDGDHGLESVVDVAGTELMRIPTSDPQQLAQALAWVRLSLDAPRCEFRLPEPPEGTIDPASALVRLGGRAVPHVESAEGCDGSAYGGWYHGHAGTETTLTLCPCSCALAVCEELEISWTCQ